MMPILNFDIILKCACFHLSFWISMFAILFKCVQYRSITRVLFFSSPHHFLSLIKFVPVDFSAVSLILLTVYFLTRSPCPTEFSLNITHAWFIRFDSFPFHLFILSSANESINPSNLARDDGIVVILSSNTTMRLSCQFHRYHRLFSTSWELFETINSYEWIWSLNLHAAIFCSCYWMTTSARSIAMKVITPAGPRCSPQSNLPNLHHTHHADRRLTKVWGPKHSTTKKYEKCRNKLV